jgi:hypothetical protein
MCLCIQFNNQNYLYILLICSFLHFSDDNILWHVHLIFKVQRSHFLSFLNQSSFLAQNVCFQLLADFLVRGRSLSNDEVQKDNACDDDDK